MSESPTARWNVNAGASSSERFAACAERGDRQPEPGDGDGERVEVDAMDRIEGRLNAGPDLKIRRVLVPAVQQPVKSAQQEVPGTAGRVDELEAFERPFLQRGFEGLVEDELLDEDRRLQQRVGVLGVLGEVLIQVAEEPRRQRLVGQVVNESTGLRAGARSPAAPSPRHRTVRRGAAPNAGRPAPLWQAGPRDSQRPASATRGRCPRDERGRRQAARRGPPADDPPARRSTPALPAHCLRRTG